MKMFIFCTFLFLSANCFGQIVSNGKDIKDFKDDYTIVDCAIIANSSGAKAFWVGDWGRDTVGNFKISQSKNLKTMGSIMKMQIANSQLKDTTGVIISIQATDEIEIMNKMGRVGFAFLRKEELPMMPLNVLSTELIRTIRFFFKRK